jgi:hypothetical protein
VGPVGSAARVGQLGHGFVIVGHAQQLTGPVASEMLCDRVARISISSSVASRAA